MEGETPLLLPEVSPAGEELWEHGEEEREERWKWDEEEKSAELQRLCQRCHIVTSQLRRQAVALTGRSSLQVRIQIISALYRIESLYITFYRLVWFYIVSYYFIKYYCIMHILSK